MHLPRVVYSRALVLSLKEDGFPAGGATWSWPLPVATQPRPAHQFISWKPQLPSSVKGRGWEDALMTSQVKYEALTS